MVHIEVHVDGRAGGPQIMNIFTLHNLLHNIYWVLYILFPTGFKIHLYIFIVYILNNLTIECTFIIKGFFHCEHIFNIYCDITILGVRYKHKNQLSVPRIER